MRASELLGRVVRDALGDDVGLVHDVRLHPGLGGAASADPEGAAEAVPGGVGEAVPGGVGEAVPGGVAGVVVGSAGRLGALAHAWGFVEGRARGPALLRSLTRPERARARFVPADAVTSWGPDALTLRGRLEDFPLLRGQESAMTDRRRPR